MPTPAGQRPEVGLARRRRLDHRLQVTVLQQEVLLFPVEGRPGERRACVTQRHGRAGHSGPGPASASSLQEEENPVSADKTKGAELAAQMLQGVSDEHMRAATRLLGSHQDGLWLRRFAEDGELEDAAGRQLIARTGGIDWDALARLMRTPGWSNRATSSEAAMLEVAVSLVGDCAVNLRQVLRVVDDAEFQLLLRALGEAMHGEGG
ncbi:hypothetical protein ABZZ17_30715 [Streptomyces sp. NPDC006512]|uniref:hypothetical protein n=1 Tax=Streptomyces sp. NPDC006512 TaxID=3154307 RepID=UPI0033A53F7E